MATIRPVSWFLTSKGKSFTFAIVTASGISFSIGRFCTHTFLLNKYKEFVHLYRNGVPVDLPQDLKNRYNKCLEILKVSDAQRKLITPFSVFGYDLFHAGSFQSRFGSIVGIPTHFAYKSMNDLEKEDIQVNQKKVDWTSEPGRKLADSLLLSENVQEFAICREILSTQNSKVYLQAAYPFLSIYFAYNVSQTLNTRLNLYRGPIGIRTVMYTLTGLFSLGVYYLLQDYTEVYYETKIDAKLCEINPEFIESGAIFYDKILKRNQALRELMGSEGAKKYSKLGNENFGLRQPRLALVHRKLFFEEQLNKVKDDNVP